MKEKIMCSAIYINDGVEHIHQPKNIETGVVICGWRHGNCFGIIRLLYCDSKGNMTDEYLSYKKNGNIKQGFLTNKNRFLNRKDSYSLAASNGQLTDKLIGSELTSEDLW